MGSLLRFSFENDRGCKHLYISCVDQITVRCFFTLPEEGTTHSLSPFFEMHFDGTMSKNAAVSSMLPTMESEHFPVLMKRAAPS